MQVIADEGLDVLHFHYAVPFAYVAQNVRRCLGDAAPRLVGTLHGTDVTHCGKDPAVAPKLAAALRCTDALTTVSHSHAASGRIGVQSAFPPARGQQFH